MAGQDAGGLVYVAMGDEIGLGRGAGGEGYVERLYERLQGRAQSVRLVNLCQGGATTLEVLREQMAPALRAHPDLVTLAVGANDVALGHPEEVFALNLAEIAARLRGSEARVLLFAVPDLSLAPALASGPTDELRQRVAVFNELLVATAARYAFAVVELPSGEDADEYAADGYHPSARGHERWAEAAWPAAEQALS